MQNSEFLQLVDRQAELAQKALLLQDCGVIKSVDVTTDISDSSYKVAVILNHYASDQLEWTASKLNYGDDKQAHHNIEKYDELLAFVDGELDRLEKRSRFIAERIAKLFNLFKK